MNWFRNRDRRRRELEDELRSHLAMAARDRMSRGERPREAEWAAKREFGNFPKVSEEVQDTWRGQYLGRLQTNLRHVVRVFAESASLTIMLAIAVASGVNARREVSPVFESRPFGAVLGASDVFPDYPITNVARTATFVQHGNTGALHGAEAPAPGRLPAVPATLVPGDALFPAIRVIPVHVWSTVSNPSRNPQPR